MWRFICCTLTLVFLVMTLSNAASAQDQQQAVTAEKDVLIEAQTNSCGAEIPALTIKQPAQNVDVDTASFLGKWGDGAWDKHMCHELVVSSIDADGTVDVHYSWGSFPPWNANQPGGRKHVGHFKDGKLIVPLREEKKHPFATYTLTEEGNLSGTYTYLYKDDPYDAYVTLKRIAPRSPSS